ncbi:unnamed protein product [Didymodactylos carnosus]|uniref:Uncharacterized protein n=2 Tax=Didymodactylos carnosus TaxID=1234261 RepID=A0A814LMQ0_9BILA|nr:unnamed protein product [Didymodactylos carnosus]CAF3835323.1 unnamed protein product [Didymodactylos carnosus]
MVRLGLGCRIHKLENKLSLLSDDEKQIEKLYNEEKYLSLYRDFDQEALYQGEENDRDTNDSNIKNSTLSLLNSDQDLEEKTKEFLSPTSFTYGTH